MVDILIIDDYQDIVTSMKETLEYIEFKTACASSVQEAMALIQDKSFEFKLALIDLGLDGGKRTGLDVIKAMRLERPEVITVAMSGCVDDEIEKMTSQAGAQETWEKSLRPRDFESNIRRLLGRKDERKTGYGKSYS
jgi:DNA-binding NtrC family response regulator